MSKYDDLPEEYRPIGPWGYFGRSLLYAIPILGFIILIINAIGNKNVNVKNYARSFFCSFILVLILGAALWFTVGASAVMAYITGLIG